MSDVAQQYWPVDCLEEVNACPVCGHKVNKKLEQGLLDFMSKPATGPWTVNSCQGCGIAYLNPRPVNESIGEAYRHYYTHSSNKDDLVYGFLRAIKDYFSEKYYAVSRGSGGFLDYLAYLFIRIMYPLSLYFDAKSRHLFSVKKRPGKLLDIGCGNGEFLRFANRYGWHVVGVDFDEKAVSEARSGGFDVRLGGIDVVGSDERFDFISLSHVIEHVYEPVDLLRSCYALLNEGGVLWLETPNIESIGYVYYKANWRGLEPPRHIMIFNQASLYKMLTEAGFLSVEQKNHGLSGIYMGLASERQKDMLHPCGSRMECVLGKIVKVFRIVSLELIQLSSKKRREYLTLIVTR